MMTGVVLCGGQSSRMGTDKGLINHENESWAKLAFDKLSTLNIPVFLSVNKDQSELYKKIYPEASLIIDNESLQVKGPLLGLLSASLLFPGEDIFILACDMPLMDSIILRQLRAAAVSNQQHDAFVFKNENEAEPLCGIYTSSGLNIILDMYRSQQLVKHSMKFVLEHINTISIPLEEEQKKFFSNFNTHAELNGL